MAVGAVAGGVVVAASEDDESTTTTTTTTTTTSQILPCAPTVINVSGVTYYQCGTQYYVQAYSSSGPIYMPVAAPDAAAPPG